MTRQTSSRDCYSARITARTFYVQQLRLPMYAARASAVGLTDEDLSTIEATGLAAERYDREQHVNLAAQQNAMTVSGEKRARFLQEVDEFRNRLPATVRKLAADPATAGLANWLARLSFERFRLRTSNLPEVATPSDGAQKDQPSAEKAGREKVVREDRLSAAHGTLQFARALLDEERAPVVADLETRGFGRERIEKLAAAAEAEVAAIKAPSRMTSPEASRLEAEAVAAQKQCWEACRRMLRAAAQGVPELAELWAKC